MISVSFCRHNNDKTYNKKNLDKDKTKHTLLKLYYYHYFYYIIIIIIIIIILLLENIYK